MNKIQKFKDLCRDNPPCQLKFDVNWSEITSLGVASTVPVLAEPSDDIELRKILLICKELNLPFFVIGAGTNIVGTDKPIEIIIIHPEGNYFSEIKFGREHVTVGAAVRLRSLVETAAEKGLAKGLEPLAGIPATIGGAIKMNAGADGVSIGDFIEEVCGLDESGNPWRMGKKELSLSYRSSAIQNNQIILAAILKLSPQNPEISRNKIREVISRRQKVVFEGRNAGCAFKNPGDAKAGILLEKAGAKLLRRNDAFFSSKHANYLINSGSATESDVVELIIEARKRVFDCFGILLEPEFKFVNPESLNLIINSTKPIEIAVLKGGNSSEREISLKSAKYVADALRNAGLSVEEIDLTEPKITDSMKEADIVFPVLHGGFGENGQIQELMEKENIRFVGSKSHSCSIAIDKIKTKKLLYEHSISTPDFAVVNKQSLSEAHSLADKIAYPIVVKAPTEGSTVGVTIVKTKDELLSAIEHTFTFGDEVLLEKFVSGIELTVGILDGKALTPIEIRTPEGFYDYDAKYLHKKGETLYLCPPEKIPLDIQNQARKIAVQIYELIDARDILRVDFIFSNSKLYVLEANSIPGFTESSLLPKAAKQDGISFVELCAGLALKAYKRD